MKKTVRNITMYFLCVGIMIFVNFLYDRNMEPCLYAIEICTFILGIVIAFDLWKERQKQKALERCEQNLREMSRYLPIANNKSDILYQHLLEEVYQEYTNVQMQYKQQEQDATDYYTMWIHQIKTPIAAMRLLLQSDHMEAQKHQLQQELQRIEQYAEMAMHYLHITNHEEDLRLEACDLSVVVKGTLKKFAVSFIEKHLEIQYEDFAYQVVTDAKWLAFLVEQIMSNSVKYTNQGGVKIYFQECGVPTLIIEDTGIGIRKEDIPRIFDKGFTGYNGHVDQRATGIGLYLCRMIGEKLGVQIEVASKVGAGTKVMLKFKMQCENMD